MIISHPIDAKGLASDGLKGGEQDQGQHAAFLPPEPASNPDPARIFLTLHGVGWGDCACGSVPLEPLRKLIVFVRAWSLCTESKVLFRSEGLLLKNCYLRHYAKKPTLGSRREGRSSSLCVANAITDYAQPSGDAAVTEKMEDGGGEKQSLLKSKLLCHVFCIISCPVSLISRN